MRCFVLILMLLMSTSAQITDPGELRIFSSLQGCVQVLFSDTGEELLNDIGCGDWFCACNHFSDAIYTLSTMAVSQCSTVAQDVSVATSVFNSFCSQISTSPTTTFYPTGLTDPFGWPNFSTLRSCVQALFGGGEELINDVNCADWSCVCADPGAPYTLSTLAASQCTDGQDVSAANSVFTAFCNQISLTASVPTAPTGVSQTASPTPSPSPTESVGSSTGTTGSSSSTETAGTSTSESQAPAAATSTTGLSQSDKIALGVGIGVGLPGTLAGIWVCILMMRR